MRFLDRRKLAGLLMLAFTLGLLAIWPTTVKAIPPQAITLLYFRGTGQNNAVLIEWATATEFETAGFIIRRAGSEAGPYSDLNEIGFIPGEGDGIIGAIYEATDSMNVVNGQTYWYILVEIENDGSENLTDPIAVTGGVPTATATATATATKTATATATTQPTSTSIPPSIPGSTSTATAQPTSTPVPTNTPGSTQVPSNPQPTTQPAGNTNNSNGSTNTNSSNTNSSTNSNSSGSSTNTNNASSSTGGNIVEASSPTDPYPAGTPSPTFVPDPNQTPDTGDSAVPYPAPGEGTEGYIAPTEVSNNRDTGATPASELQGGNPNSLSTQPPLDQPAGGNTAAQSSSTLILWIGFTAAFLIFVGGIIGSIFLFTRRSNQK